MTDDTESDDEPKDAQTIDDELPCWQEGGEGWDLRYLFGFCPVQGYGTVDGKEFYFRARGDTWSFEVSDVVRGTADAEREHGSYLPPEFWDKIFFRTGAYYDNSGWMAIRAAHGLITRCIELYRATGGATQPAPYRFTEFPGT